MIPAQSLSSEKALRDQLNNDPSDWETRRMLVRLVYDNENFEEAANLIWDADPIPSTDLDLAFAARVLAKSQPRKAIRLLAAILELNRGKAVQNMGMANALLHHGMVLQAARFYGAALEADPSLVNPDLEHFVLWTDDEMWLWGDFTERRPKLGELPWMARDPMEALKLTSKVSVHTTPIAVPQLPPVEGEELRHEMYQQEPKLNGKLTPPPAVTIPIDRVDPKHRIYDSTHGADVSRQQQQTPAAPAKPAQPAKPAAAQPAKPAAPAAAIPSSPPAVATAPAVAGPPSVAAASAAQAPAARPPLPSGPPTQPISPLKPPPRSVPSMPQAASLDPVPKRPDGAEGVSPSVSGPAPVIQPPAGAAPTSSALPAMGGSAPVLMKRPALPAAESTGKLKTTAAPIGSAPSGEDSQSS